MMLGLASIGVSTYVCPPAAEAAIMGGVIGHVDGAACYHSDINYPFWSMGNRGGSFLDVSSAYVYARTREYTEVAASNYFVMYEGDNMKAAGIIYIRAYTDGRLMWSKNSDYGFDTSLLHNLNDAYYLVRVKLGI